MISYVFFIQTLVIACTVFNILAQTHHKCTNGTSKILKVTFKVTQHHDLFLKTALVSPKRKYMILYNIESV